MILSSARTAVAVRAFEILLRTSRQVLSALLCPEAL